MNADGTLRGTAYSATGALSDCKPAVIGGQVRWYVTNDAGPVFYSIDPAKPDSSASTAKMKSFIDTLGGR